MFHLSERSIQHNTPCMEKAKQIRPRKGEKECINKSVVRRLESFFTSKLCRLLSESNHSRNGNRIPTLHQRDILIGSFIENGAFSDIYHVAGFCEKAQNAPPIGESHSYVIKRIRREISSGEKQFYKASRNLTTEAAILGRLNHPHIVKLRACCTSTETLKYGSHDGLILDRLDSTLRQRIDLWKCEGQEPLKDVNVFVNRLSHALEIAEALEYIHDRRLIFRDLKPGTVGFKGNTVQLFDFGLCRKLPSFLCASGPDERYQMSYVGTPRYVAPELHLKKGYNLKADTYSWAIVCYEMMSLNEPYRGMNRRDHYTMVCLEGVRPILDDEMPWSEDLEDLLHQSWCPALRDRLSMREVCESLEEIIASSTGPGMSDDIYAFEEDDSESTVSTLSEGSWMSDDDTIASFEGDDDDWNE